MLDEILYSTQREAVRAAALEARETGGTVFICRGVCAACGCTEDGCPDCYQISPHDCRSPEEHINAFARRDA